MIASAAAPPIDDPLATLAIGLASQHGSTSAASAKDADLLQLFEENRRLLFDTHRSTAEAAAQGLWIAPAGEWLLDNFHVVKEQLREGREDLPRRFYRELPRVADGAMAGMPRPFVLAKELIAHTDGRLDIASLTRFILAYQTVTPLTMGELWAIPIALRHAFLDRLAQIAVLVEDARAERASASRLAAELALIASEGPDKVAQALARRVGRRTAPSTTTFAAELLLRLRDQDPALASAAAWLERRIQEQGTTLDLAIREEHRQQASNQLSVGNAISSMRTITATNWSEVFESLSLVEECLRQDPASAYPRMDFATRDHYRHQVERMARRSRAGELEVARLVVAQAQSARQTGLGDPLAPHVGFHLLDDQPGQGAIEQAIGYRPTPWEHLRRRVLRRGALVYLTAVALVTLVVADALASLAGALGATVAAGRVLGLLAVLPASGVAVSLVNALVTALLPPRVLPKLDFTSGIPLEFRTFVVVPTMLSSEGGLAQLLEALEVRYLANPDPQLHFALLTDFADASEASAAGDEGLLAAARGGIERLNLRHAAAPFSLYHRHRRWSAGEGAFIGWERKRGKLDEFNRLLLGERGTSFTTVIAPPAAPSSFRFVLTLDSDTQLPRDAAATLVGVLAHPLNQPRLDEHGRVVAGHAVLQPRVSVSLESSRSSRFSRIVSQQVGLDPYTSAVSDVYQDLFGEGSFVGKGLYDLRALDAALAGRIPENTVLSHDLLEGLFARSALVSDVELFDDAPSSYLASSLRRHRWVRGDWQIAPWLRRRVPLAGGGRARSELSAISRWKIADNLRRSWVPQLMLALLVAGWCLVARPLSFTAVVLAVFASPVLGQWVGAALRQPGVSSVRSRLRRLMEGTASHLVQYLLELLFLPHQALVGTDATARALYRRLVSHRHVLEWTSAARGQRLAPRSPFAVYRSMLLATVGAVLLCAMAAVLARSAPAIVVVALFAGGWALAPLAAWWLSRESVPVVAATTAVDRYYLRRTARKTWRYFEEFIGEADNHLPPDNYQADRASPVAHRTSPTNIGLALLANFTALDLGYLGLLECAERLERMMASLARLERHRGHLFNWYETQTLSALSPRYISTVDSGNLAAMLIAMKEACLQAAPRAAGGAQLWDGLVDTLRLIDEEVDRMGQVGRPGRRAAARLQPPLARLNDLVGDRPTVRAEVAARLDLLGAAANDLLAQLDGRHDDGRGDELGFWSGRLAAQIESHRRDLRELQEGPRAGDPALAERWRRLAAQAAAHSAAMEFRFLYDPERKVFSIGFDVQAGRTDASFYDLLASEARLASLIAIAKGDVPLAHWFKLGRPLVQVGRDRALLSWTGTMFEYLMPQLLLRSYPGTLLTESCRVAVRRQIGYGRERRIPWGISESAYNARDLRLDYQYGPFGVPGLGIKRNLEDDLVVSPYSTALALLVEPRAAVENFWRLGAQGLDGAYGFYEAIDYTPGRVPAGHRGVVVRAFMAHHQGMTLLAIGEHLLGGPMSHRFHSDPAVRAIELLLQERVPYDAALEEPQTRERRRGQAVRTTEHEPWHAFDAQEPLGLQLLSNGTYSVMVTRAGGGYSRCGELAVTRWREDPTRDHSGQFLYLREIVAGRPWSADAARPWSSTYQPTLDPSPAHDTCFPIDKAEFRQTRDGLEVHTSISVSSEDDVELRIVTLSDRSGRPRDLEVTSYAEVVLAPHAADLAHPAFSNLFVETEYLEAPGALLATRRRRSALEPQIWGVHVVCVDGEARGEAEHETDRQRFVGRGQSPRHPAAQDPGAPRLSGTVGPVLDPIFSLRRRVHVAAGQRCRVIFATGVASTREGAVALASKYATPAAADRVLALAWTHAQAQLHYLDVDAEAAHTFLRLAAPLVYSSSQLRASEDTIAANRRGQSGLWAYGVSGDLPILLVRVDADAHLDLIREALRAHEYFRLRGLAVELVILNEHAPTYRQSFQDQVLAIARSSLGGGLMDRPGGVFVRRADLMPPEDQTLFSAAARAILVGGRGTLAEQLDRGARRTEVPRLPPLRVALGPSLRALLPAWSRDPERRADPAPGPAPAAPLEFPSRLGGFSGDGREYVVTLGAGQWTPAPWSNVLANPRFGALVTESGGGFEWSGNSHEDRLTRWSNDVVCDPPSSTLYVRDEDSGRYWSATPLPIRGAEPWTVRHGQGYSVFAATTDGIAHELRLFVHPEDPVKVARLTLRNVTRAPRRLTVTGYVEWTLGVTREQSGPQIVTAIDREGGGAGADGSGALIARGGYPGATGHVAFVDTVPAFRSFSGDRAEFLGRNGDPAQPSALDRVGLSGRVGAGHDPCAAVQLDLTLAPGQQQEVVLLVGDAPDIHAARALLARHREPGAASRTEAAVRQQWDSILGAIEVTTPDRALDLLVNRWLIYQVLSCRLWARSAFYQSGGAYGFRDQLQDVSSLVHTRPQLARDHLLRAASRQFLAGDVQHWWHPPGGQGVRTRFVDDALWLPYIADHYIAVTGDAAVLDKRVPFLEARALEEGEHEAYLVPTISEESATLFEHCARALDRSLAVGAHGLPLMGGGDWNDGMNRVGAGGRGESVWMGWFLLSTIEKFLPLCAGRGEVERVARYRAFAEALKVSLERDGWDGRWYRRAFFDDGTPLGTAQSDECRIDSIAQSWAVLSGAADPARAAQALASADELLVDREAQLVKLLAPPFDHSARDPGYIKGYVPGVRENGGQYSHAAAWLAQAHTRLGNGDRAAALLAMISPIRRSQTAQGMERYRLEPYVLAGDVAGVAPLAGRGGWSWYTGAASWFYRVAVESLLGLVVRGDVLAIDPCVPRDWPGFTLVYRRGATSYRFQVDNPAGVGRGVVLLELDGVRQERQEVRYHDDGARHEVRVVLGSEQAREEQPAGMVG